MIHFSCGHRGIFLSFLIIYYTNTIFNLSNYKQYFWMESDLEIKWLALTRFNWLAPFSDTPNVKKAPATKVSHFESQKKAPAAGF